MEIYRAFKYCALCNADLLNAYVSGELSENAVIETSKILYNSFLSFVKKHGNSTQVFLYTECANAFLITDNIQKYGDLVCAVYYSYLVTCNLI